MLKCSFYWKLNKIKIEVIKIKLICDCGNEGEFTTVDDETGEQTSVTEDEGQYAKINSFEFWQQHDVVGCVCSKCGKAIWMFT